MPFNGTGTYTLPGAQLATGETVSASENNTFRNDVATALTDCVTRDGQSPATANLPMGGYKLTNLASGTGAGDSVRYEQLPSATNLVPVASGGTGSGNASDARTALGVAIGTDVQAYNAELQGATQGGINGFKNRIINGAMMISQRGTSFSTPAVASYTLDRWMTQWTGAAPASIAQVAGSGQFKNALKITGNTGNTLVEIEQRIESYNCFDLSGATVTIQANIVVSSAQTVQWHLYHANTQDNFSAITLIASGTWSATTSPTTFTASVANLPASAVNGLRLCFFPNNYGAFTSGTFTITGVQLEKGSTATSFDYRPYGTELALCQRYFYQIGGNGNYERLAFGGMWNSTTVGTAVLCTPVPLRSASSISIGYSNLSHIAAVSGGATISISSLGLDMASDKNISVAATVASGGVSGQACFIVANGTSSARLYVSSEL